MKSDSHKMGAIQTPEERVSWGPERLTGGDLDLWAQQKAHTGFSIPTPVPGLFLAPALPGLMQSIQLSLYLPV